MNEQVKKRSNPFDRPLSVEQEPVIEEVETSTRVEPQIQQQPVYEAPQNTYYQPQQTQQTVRQQKRQQKQQYIQQIDGPKEKYTATMDVSLRRSIKIFCATNGKMFSEFIEEACREKLNREGARY